MQRYRQQRLRATLVAAACAAAIGCVTAVQGGPSVNERLDNLERKVDSRGLVDLLTRVDQLQRDVQKLRGDIEVQNHTIEDLQRQQREQYLDIDRRLQLLETGGQPAVAPVADMAGGAGSAPVTPAVSPPAGSTPPAGVLAPATAPAAGATIDDPATMQAEYDTALAILREGRYSDAALAFDQFITRYPTGPLTDNAHYWLGETYYVTRDFDKAKATFGKLVSTYPNSPKVADSRLKVGFILYEQQKWKEARAELEAVVGNYPTSTAARLASDRLARMKKEGH
jgi:tol-pal system protein YbgF